MRRATPGFDKAGRSNDVGAALKHATGPTAVAVTAMNIAAATRLSTSWLNTETKSCFYLSNLFEKLKKGLEQNGVGEVGVIHTV